MSRCWFAKLKRIVIKEDTRWQHGCHIVRNIIDKDSINEFLIVFNDDRGLWLSGIRRWVPVWGGVWVWPPVAAVSFDFCHLLSTSSRRKSLDSIVNNLSKLRKEQSEQTSHNKSLSNGINPTSNIQAHWSKVNKPQTGTSSLPRCAWMFEEGLMPFERDLLWKACSLCSFRNLLRLLTIEPRDFRLEEVTIDGKYIDINIERNCRNRGSNPHPTSDRSPAAYATLP